MAKFIAAGVLAAVAWAVNCSESPWPSSEQQLIDSLGEWTAEQLSSVSEADVVDLVSEKRWVEGARQFV